MKILFRQSTIGISLCLLLAAQSWGAVISFNSLEPSENAATRAAWLGATGSTPSHFLDFESGFSVGDDISTGAPASLIPGGLSFSQGIITDSSGDLGSSNPIDTYTPAMSGDLTLSFAGGVNYLGFFDIDYASGTLEVTLADSSVVEIDRDTTNPAGDSAEFFGLLSDDQLIMSVLLTRSGSVDSEWGLDNLEYGKTVVPLPAACWLFGSALAGLGWIRRRQTI